jgi:molybdopterin-binding protein
MDGEVMAVDLANGAIITATIADGAVTTEKIADGAVTTAKLADDAIVTMKLADDAVTSMKILDGTISALDLASNAVDTIEIVNGAVTTDKLADNAVTDTKLAPGAIPFASASGAVWEQTTSTSYVLMPDMTVTLTLTRTSHLVIMWSGEAWISPAGNNIVMRAMVDSVKAGPGTDHQLTTDSSISSYSCIFYLPNVSSGSHTVSIEWRVPLSGSIGNSQRRTLTVLALPA